ncbi:MAG TPA: ABC transporter permease [Actinocrinis sp.]|jgi:branched-chain amino acid transport system permease protein
MIALELAFAGLAVGCVAALCALGLIVTYRVTGVFNFGFGAIGMLCAYLLRQSVEVWRVPVAAAAVVVLAVVAPGIGLVLDRFVFRPLRRRSADPAENLVATLGVFVLLVGIVVLLWGIQGRSAPPSILPSGSVRLGGGVVVADQSAGEVAVVVVLAVALSLLLRATRLGLYARAVVDRRDLAELVGIRSDRLAAASWAVGGLLAGLAGVLIAPSLELDPYGLSLVMLETMGVAVAARFASLTTALVAALALGIGQSELSLLHPGGDAQSVLSAAEANLFVILLLAALLIVPRLDGGARADAGGTDAGAMRRFATRGSFPAPAAWWLPFPVLLALPLALDPVDLEAAQAVPALAVIFVSIVVVTGYSGQVSLGQAGYAGLGALLFGRLAAHTLPGAPAMPALVALPVAALLVGVVGVLTGWPIIHRRGLYLALITFAVAVCSSRFVFEQPLFTSGLSIGRPAPFISDRTFYLLELGCLAVALCAVRALHGATGERGRVGRALVAIRDSEPAAQAAGIDTARLKLAVFAAGAALAGLGGALLSMSTLAFDSSSFDPVQGLVWFAAVVVCGADSAAGAVLGAGAVVALDTAVANGSSTVAVGIGAILLGWLPGGLALAVRRVGGELRTAAAQGTIPEVPPVSIEAVRLTPLGEQVASRVALRRRAITRRATESGSGEHA